jgi:hypothetical protein
MSNNAPSAAAVAAELQRQNTLAEMSVSHPDLYGKYQAKRGSEYVIAAFVAMIVGMPLLILFSSNAGPNAPPIGIAFIVPIIGLVFVVAHAIASLFVNSKSIVDTYADSIIRRRLELEKMTRDINHTINEAEALKLGDTIIAHPGATIINRSTVINSNIKNQTKNPEIATALKMLAGYVEHSKSQDAADSLQNLTEEIDQKKRSPSKIRAYWNELVRVLPAVASLGTAAAAIAKLYMT